jgi:hypothetical protein
MNAKLISAMAAVFAVSVYAGGAQAAASLCSVTGSPNSDGLTYGDVTFEGSAADDCYGIVTNPPSDAEDLGGLELWGDTVTAGGWEFLLKDGGTLSSPIEIFDEDGLNGVTYTFKLDGGLDTSDPDADPADLVGAWTLTVTPEDDLPIQLDFVVVLAAGSGWAAYLFDDVTIEASLNDGTYTLVFDAGQSTNLAELSHMSLYVRDYFYPDDDDEPPVLVPEPGVLFLMGAGLLGLGMARRRKSA